MPYPTPDYLLKAAEVLIAHFKDTNPEELEFQGFRGLVKAVQRAKRERELQHRWRRQSMRRIHPAKER